MPPLTPERRAQLRRATREAAAAFMEDIPYLRENLLRPFPQRAAIRRCSAILRRLLVERDLPKIADPRIDSLRLQQFNNEVLHQTANRRNARFFASCGVDFGGVEFRGISFMPNALTDLQVRRDYEEGRVAPPPNTLVSVRFDNFMAENLLAFNGRWISLTASQITEAQQ
jgi:hypothetical protein